MAVVIIPAYKPERILKTLVEKLWAEGCQIVVVDDGSGREYSEIFEEVQAAATVLRHDENRGKGAAIKTALKYIWKNMKNCQVIGVMDADGQHLPEDMMKVLEMAGMHKDSVVLGVRNIGKEMPWKSRIGNQITRCIFHICSGVEVSDTQTGLRAFSTELLNQFVIIAGERYEYETNVLMSVAKAGIPIKEVPIHTVYKDRENSTSHFRVVQDSVRIYKDLLKFSMSSFSSFILDYLLFVLLTWSLPRVAITVVVANIIARVISAFYNYTMNCKFVFHKAMQIQTALDYFALAAFILLINNVVLEMFLHTFHVPAYQAKLMTECVLFMISWLVQNKLIFRKRL